MRNYQNCLLDPEQVVMAIIDEQPQMFFGVESDSRACIENNVVALAKAAQVFNVPCILSTVEASGFSGWMYSRLQNVYPGINPLDRTMINAWEDANFKAAVEGTGRKKLILAGLWTEACVTFPALCALSDGYEVYVVTDASGGASKAAHHMAILRMVQFGVIPLTWQQTMLEFQRDWNNKDTYDAVMGIIKEHSGAYGLGVEYAQSMLPQG
ncbi:MAG: hydrolase [Christensenellaceae bacterium]|jgi:nicotinamidase-related amidase|nr:hydrolase [Christensenellaceae bacterium]